MSGRVVRLFSARPRLSIALIAVIFATVGLWAQDLMSPPATDSTFGDIPPPMGLERAVATIFPADRCVTAVTAEAAVQSVLAELQVSDWDIGHGPGVGPSDCVGATIDASGREVRLLMALSPALREDLTALAEKLLETCHTRGEAAALLTSVLAESGADTWDLQTGRISGPAGREEEVMEHVSRGCWIYSGTGWTSEGLRIYWIGGK